MINGWEMDYSTGLIVGDMHGLWAGTGGIVSVTDQTLTTTLTKNTGDRLLKPHTYFIGMGGTIS